MNNYMDFRYYDNVKKIFVYSEEFVINNDFEKLSYFFKQASNNAMRVDQCINQTDKFGKPIYFNDILFVPAGYSGDSREPESLVLVEYFYDDSHPGPDDVYWNNIEIIGNIYQEPKMIDYVDAYKKENHLRRYSIKDILRGYYEMKSKDIFGGW